MNNSWVQNLGERDDRGGRINGLLWGRLGRYGYSKNGEDWRSDSSFGF